jgi:phosphatidylglycerol lysyltransferase
MNGVTEVSSPAPQEPVPPPPATQAVAAPKLTSIPGTPPSSRSGRIVSRLAPFAAAAFFALALWGVRSALGSVRYRTVWHAILSLSAGQIGLAITFTVLGYVALTGYDVLALRYVGHPLDYPRTGLASFISFAFSNSVGLALLTGASVRTRLYSMWGLPTPVIGRVVAFGAATLWIGMLAVAGIALTLEPGTIAPMVGAPAWVALIAGITALCLVGAYLLWCGVWRRPLAVLGWTFDPPGIGIAFGQLAVSALEWLMAAGVLFALLPPDSGLSYPAFAGIFVAAQALGLASHVPGGLGVFEGTMLLLAGSRMPVGALAGALLAFRTLYYLIPLLGAAVLLGSAEGFHHREHIGRVSDAVRRLVPAFAAPLLAVGVFATGTILLLSGATPTSAWRLQLLRDLIPLPVLEASHFIASLAGAGLVFLAYGLYRRMNAAWLLTVVLLGTGAITSLLKGLDFEEATIAAVALMALLPARARFYRRSSLLAERWSPGWMVAVAVAIGTSVWLGFFAYQHVEYSTNLWWQFEFAGDAPRFLRATVGAVSLALVLAMSRLFRPARPEPTDPTIEDLDRAVTIIARQPTAAANLAILGDKSLLFNDSGAAFLMYAVQGRSWVALGDPIGGEADAAELAWRFRDLAARHGGWPVFYQVSRHHLPIYLEQGLTLAKIGEVARVALPTFSLDGSNRARFRNWRNACERAGCTVDVLPSGGSDTILEDLRRVSDEWLATKRTREKWFSLGAFSPQYLRHFPIAVVRQKNRVVAFASLFVTETRDEMSVDLMRYGLDAPPNVMTYLFVQLMLWGREQGYQWFDLGMAPLAGLRNRAFAPLWNRVGAFVFRQGENFYNFKGLREYKDRFDPVWEPRYLASPGGLALPFILTDIASLIGGGLKGVFTK